MSSGDQVAQGMQRWAGKVALVTGASDGIGRAIAIRLLKCGMKIIGCGRRIEALEVSGIGSKSHCSVMYILIVIVSVAS